MMIKSEQYLAQIDLDYMRTRANEYPTLAAKWLNVAENEYHYDRDSAAKKLETIANSCGLSDRKFDSNWLRRSVFHPSQQVKHNSNKRGNAFPLWLAKSAWLALGEIKWTPERHEEYVAVVGIFLQFNKDVSDYDELVGLLPDHLITDVCCQYLAHAINSLYEICKVG